jgi:small-conductance mechanosensitive channel
MLLLRMFAILLIAGALIDTSIAADAPSAAPPTQTAPSRAVMTGEQVIRILDETVDWYRTLGAQQQWATQPSDLLILYANRQIADRVIGLAFDLARANAELLSSEAEVAQKAAADTASSPQAMQRVQQQLDARRAELQAEITSLQRGLAARPKAQGGEVQARISQLQSELDLVNARRNLYSSIAQFTYQSDANGTGASALKAHIDAIAASLPSSSSGAAPAAAAAGSPAGSVAASTALSASGSGSENGAGRIGIWDLASNVMRLADKLRIINTADRRTADLQNTFTQIGAPPQEKIKALSAQGDALAAQADSSSGAAPKGVRDQFDTLAWLFKQTAAIVIPLSREDVLLGQYRRNLTTWRDNAESQYFDALKALGVRVAILLGLLATVFAGAEAWRRGVLRYVQEPRRRYQLLLVRRIVCWALAVTIVGFTFATDLGSLATFAGLLTAGLAVAMQSVLVSIVGYFFLIGKYGIRVGDRVQIGNVSGEVVDVGLVRLHLMELSGQPPRGPTGRIVAFANSIVFQASGGIFKHIHGVNLAWHDITLALPPKADPYAMKEKLSAAANQVLSEYSEDIARQTREIQKTTSLNASDAAQTQVQLRFSASAVEALVRYPVQLQHAAEIDERMSQELMTAVADAAA